MAPLARRPLPRHERTGMTEEPPAMFRRPPIRPIPSRRSRGSDLIVTLHTEWARMHAEPTEGEALGPRMRNRTRSVTSRFVGGADHRFLGDLIRAVDAIATRCDELSARVANMEVVADDLARVSGQEITQLRAAVESIAEPDVQGRSPPSTPMSVLTKRPAAVVLTSSWPARHSELSFVTRALAGAVPHAPCHRRHADEGRCNPGRWSLRSRRHRRSAGQLIGRGPATSRWIDRPRSGFDLGPGPAERGHVRPPPGLRRIPSRRSPSPRSRTKPSSSLRQLALTPGPLMGPSDMLGMHVPINPLAGTSPAYGTRLHRLCPGPHGPSPRPARPTPHPGGGLAHVPIPRQVHRRRRGGQRRRLEGTGTPRGRRGRHPDRPLATAGSSA